MFQNELSSPIGTVIAPLLHKIDQASAT